MVIPVAEGFELRRALTGEIVATVVANIAYAGVASDGSYVWAASSTEPRFISIRT